MRKIIRIRSAVVRIPERAVLMIGGFMSADTPATPLSRNSSHTADNDLTVIENDTARPVLALIS